MSNDASAVQPVQPAVVVLQSFPEPTARSNPYVTLLLRSLRDQPGVTVETFSYRRALTSRYDVFHVHWPENLVTGKRPATTAVRQLLCLLILVRLRVNRTPVVRTLHNLGIPDGLNRRQRALLRLARRWTSLFVVLNRATPVPEGRAVEVIPHADYRDSFAGHRRAERVPRRLAFVGLVRRYKGVDALLRAFRDLPADDGATPTLRIAGRPSTRELADDLAVLTAADPRIGLRMEFLSDADLVTEITGAELVVLPYPHMHNSGTVLAALTLNRPVLVPDNEVNRTLAEEVGPAWVQRYQAPLTGSDLTAALSAVSTIADDLRPDLSHRGWDESGARHAAAYRRAVATR